MDVDIKALENEEEKHRKAMAVINIKAIPALSNHGKFVNGISVIHVQLRCCNCTLFIQRSDNHHI